MQCIIHAVPPILLLLLDNYTLLNMNPSYYINQNNLHERQGGKDDERGEENIYDLQ